MLSREDLAELCEVAGRIARQAGERINELTPQQRHVQFKGRRDMVTEVDQASEELIISAIQSQYPDHAIVAEESGGTAFQDAAFRWYIDPLDGTTNFVHGFPAYCVSLACSHEETLVAAAIYDPVKDELFTAWLGGGAYLNDRRISVSLVAGLQDSLLATGFPYVNDEVYHQNMSLWVKIYGQTQGLRRGGAAALDLAYVAAGRLDGFWEYSLSPWDQAAGALLVTEAGGKVTRTDGSAFIPEHKSILASNTVLHPVLLEQFKGIHS